MCVTESLWFTVLIELANNCHAGLFFWLNMISCCVQIKYTSWNSHMYLQRSWILRSQASPLTSPRLNDQFLTPLLPPTCPNLFTLLHAALWLDQCLWKARVGFIPWVICRTLASPLSPARHAWLLGSYLITLFIVWAQLTKINHMDLF